MSNYLIIKDSLNLIKKYKYRSFIIIFCICLFVNSSLFDNIFNIAPLYYLKEYKAVINYLLILILFIIFIFCLVPDMVNRLSLKIHRFRQVNKYEHEILLKVKKLNKSELKILQDVHFSKVGYKELRNNDLDVIGLVKSKVLLRATRQLSSLTLDNFDYDLIPVTKYKISEYALDCLVSHYPKLFNVQPPHH